MKVEVALRPVNYVALHGLDSESMNRMMEYLTDSLSADWITKRSKAEPGGNTDLHMMIRQKEDESKIHETAINHPH